MSEKNGKFEGFNYRGENGPETIIDNLIQEIDEILDTTGINSVEERDLYLQKLYTALAISNNDSVRERIKYIEERYGNTNY